MSVRVSPLPSLLSSSSRQPAIRGLAIRFASTSKPQPRPRQPIGTTSSTATKAPLSATIPRPSSDPKYPALRSAWPWRPASLLAPTPPAGFAEEERIIYARPYEGPMGSRVKMLWFLFPFGGLIIGMDEDKPWYWRLDNLGVIAVATSLCCLWSFLPTRFITRLAVVKRYPVSSSPTAPGKTTEFLRMQHGGHLMSLTDKAPMRDLQLSDVAIKAIGRPGETSYLNVKITPGGKKSRFSLDFMGYRLDFRDTKLIKSTDQEVVLSLNRIEHVFGTLR